MERACETNRSGNPGALAEAGLIPFAAVENVGQGFGRADNIFEAIIKWREAEPQHIWRAKVANDPACDQGLHHSVPVRMREDDVAAPLLRIARRGEAKLTAARFDLIDEEL